MLFFGVVPERQSVSELWRSVRDGEELISDMALGDRRLESSDSPPEVGGVGSVSVSSPSRDLLSDVTEPFSPCSCFRIFRRYLALAFWNHTWNTQRDSVICGLIHSTSGQYIRNREHVGQLGI